MKPTRPEVNAWRKRTGRGASEAVDHFWPGLAGADRERTLARVRKWAQLDRDAGLPDAPSRAATGTSAAIGAPEEDGGSTGGDPPRPAPDLDTARLDKVPFLEWQLSELLADLAWVRAAGLVGRIASLNSEVSDVRQRLDIARAEGGKLVDVERSPAGVAAGIVARQKRIEELAKRAERDL